MLYRTISFAKVVQDFLKEGVCIEKRFLSHGPIVSHLSFCLTALSERLVEMTRVTAAKEGLELLSWCFQPGAAFEWGGP